VKRTFLEAVQIVSLMTPPLNALSSPTELSKSIALHKEAKSKERSHIRSKTMVHDKTVFLMSLFQARASYVVDFCLLLPRSSSDASE
jgi:hypothetical protein